MTDYLTNYSPKTNNFKGDSRIYICLYVHFLYERGVIRMVEACFNSLTRQSNVEPVTYEVE